MGRWRGWRRGWRGGGRRRVGEGEGGGEEVEGGRWWIEFGCGVFIYPRLIYLSQVFLLVQAIKSSDTSLSKR